LLAPAIAQQRTSIGIGAEHDVAVAQATSAQLQDARRQLQLAHDQSLRSLEILLGRYPKAELRARTDLTPLPEPVPAGMPLEMLERRPDLIAAERRIATAFQRVGEAKAAMLPRITLNASASVIDSDIVELQSDYDNPAIGAGAIFVAPLYAGGAFDAQVEIRTAQQREAVAEYGRRVLNAIGGSRVRSRRVRHWPTATDCCSACWRRTSARWSWPASRTASAAATSARCSNNSSPSSRRARR